MASRTLFLAAACALVAAACQKDDAPGGAMGAPPAIAGARQDLSSQGLPASMLVPGQAELSGHTVTLPDEKEPVPALLVKAGPVRLELISAPGLSMPDALAAQPKGTVEVQQVTDGAWTVVTRHDDGHYQVATWRADTAVLCRAGALATKVELKDATKLCESLRPLPR